MALVTEGGCGMSVFEARLHPNETMWWDSSFEGRTIVHLASYQKQKTTRQWLAWSD